jgi:hypothetical protein
MELRDLTIVVRLLTFDDRRCERYHGRLLRMVLS